RQSSGQVANLLEFDDHHGARWPVAWCGLELRPLGPVARAVAVPDEGLEAGDERLAAVPHGCGSIDLCRRADRLDIVSHGIDGGVHGAVESTPQSGGRPAVVTAAAAARANAAGD